MSAIERYRHAGKTACRASHTCGRMEYLHAVLGEIRRTLGQSDHISATKSMVHEGRYIREDLAGPIGSGTHEKTSILGLNNIRNRYEYMTADSYDAVILLYTSGPGKPEFQFLEYAYTRR